MLVLLYAPLGEAPSYVIAQLGCFLSLDPPPPLPTKNKIKLELNEACA